MFAALWNKYLWGKKNPWVKVDVINGKPQPVDWNDAWVAQVRESLGEVAVGRSDRDCVLADWSKQPVAREEPRLQVLHSSIGDDGQVKIELDWNTEFIEMLREAGIGSIEMSEDEVIQLYLARLSADSGAIPAYEAQDMIREATSDLAKIDEEIVEEIDAANRALAKSQRRAEAAARRASTAERKTRRSRKTS